MFWVFSVPFSHAASESRLYPALLESAYVSRDVAKGLKDGRSISLTGSMGAGTVRNVVPTCYRTEMLNNDRNSWRPEEDVPVPLREPL